MTLNGVMAVTLRYFTEFGNLRPNTLPLPCASKKKFTFAISSADELFVILPERGAVIRVTALHSRHDQ